MAQQGALSLLRSDQVLPQTWAVLAAFSLFLTCNVMKLDD